MFLTVHKPQDYKSISKPGSAGSSDPSHDVMSWLNGSVLSPRGPGSTPGRCDSFNSAQIWIACSTFNSEILAPGVRVNMIYPTSYIS